MEYYLAIKKNEILPFATKWMELEGTMLSEISQRKIPHDFTYMWNLRNLTDDHRGRVGKIKTEREANHKRLINTENKQRVAGGDVDGGWANWVMGIKEGTWDEHWLLCGSNESLDSTPETQYYTVC